MNITFRIYLATKSKWVHLTKTIDMPTVPRVGEYVKFKNDEMGDYFGFKVTEVTYRETGAIEIMTEPLDFIDDGIHSFDDEDEEEFEEYYDSYLQEGWSSERGIKPNNRYKVA